MGVAGFDAFLSSLANQRPVVQAIRRGTPCCFSIDRRLGSFGAGWSFGGFASTAFAGFAF